MAEAVYYAVFMGVFTFIILFGLWAVLAIVAFSMLTHEEAPASYFVVAIICPPIALYLVYELKQEAKMHSEMDMDLAKINRKTGASDDSYVNGDTEFQDETGVNDKPKIDGGSSVKDKRVPWEVAERLKLAREYASMPVSLKKEPLDLKELFNFKELHFNEEWALEAVRKRVGFDTQVKAISSGLTVASASQAKDADGVELQPSLPSGVNVPAWRMIGRARGLLKLILKDYGLAIADENAGTSELLRLTGKLVAQSDAVQCACLASLNDAVVALVDPADKETYEAKLEFMTGSDEAELLFKRFPSKYGEAAAIDFDYFVNNDNHGVSDKEEEKGWPVFLQYFIGGIISLILYWLMDLLGIY